MDIKDLRRQGHSIREIVRMTGHSRNTVRNTLRQKAPEPFRKSQRTSKLDPFKSYIGDRFSEFNLSGVRLLEEIRPMGYTGSVDLICRHLKTLRPLKAALEKATVRFETPPGQQAQADWAYCGRFPDATGRQVPVYAFVFVLGFSRSLFVRFTSSMDVPTLIECHKLAFERLGGWPREILYDNMKQVRLGPNEWNPLFLDFANHYGFTPKTHRIRRPRTKGKVERMVFYVKDNFLTGRTFADLADLNAQCEHWLDHTANVRVHATTGAKPADLLALEGLTPVQTVATYKIAVSRNAKVGADSFVRIDGSRYSVPPANVGQTVAVTIRDEKIVVRAGDTIIAEHAKAAQPGSCMTHKAHLDELWKLALAGQNGKPQPQWRVTWQGQVAVTPLSRYEEVAR